MPSAARISILAVLAAVLQPTVAHGATLTAPDAYGSIQAVIDVSNPGDVIEITEGTFDEALTIPHDLTLTGNLLVRTELILSPATALGLDGAIVVEPGAGLTLNHVDVSGSTSRGIYATGGSVVNLADVVLRDSAAESGAGAHVEGALLAVDLRVENTTADQGALYVEGDLNCQRCTVLRLGVGMLHTGGELTLVDNAFLSVNEPVASIDSTFDIRRTVACDVSERGFLLAGSGTISSTAVLGSGDHTLAGIGLFMPPEATAVIDHVTVVNSVAPVFPYDIRYLGFTPVQDTGATGDTGGYWDFTLPPGQVTVRNSLFADTVPYDLYASVGVDPLVLDMTLENNGHTGADLVGYPLGTGSVANLDPVGFVGAPDLISDLCPAEAALPTYDAPIHDLGSDLDPDGSVADLGASGGPDTWAAFHLDTDGDGFTAAKECNDASSAAYPGAEEICDLLDNDCDGDVDTDATVIPTWYLDGDGDGFGDGATVGGFTQCDAPPEVDVGGILVPFAPNGDDCDDTDAAVNPAAPEDCDPVDRNCDSSPDYGATDATGWSVDADGDDHGDATSAIVWSCLRPSASHIANSSDDCNDADPAIHPGATDLCDGVDDNCTGNEDDATDRLAWYPDADGDGFPDEGARVDACTAPADHVAERPDGLFDCDDAEALAFPGNPESCDGIDNDCSGLADDLQATPGTWYADDDGDGYGSSDPLAAVTSDCPAPGYVDTNTDCNDADPEVRPGADEPCNGRDDDCSGTVDDGPTSTWYRDRDGDGYGADAVEASCQPPNTVSEGGDCQDAVAEIHPGAEEIPGNDIDEDCVDGAADPASTPKGEPSASGCQCSTGPGPAPLAWLGLVVLAAFRRRRVVALSAGLAACAPGEEPPSDGLPDVKLQFATLHEASTAGPFFAVDEPAGPALLQRQSRATFVADRPGLVALHHRGGDHPVDGAMELSAYGRAELQQVPASSTPEALGNRVVLDRGAMVEWYLNTASGLEQGFTLRERLPGRESLRIVLTVSDLTVVSHGPEALSLVDADGVLRYRYDHLLVTDAREQPVASHLEGGCQAEQCTITLVVDDAEATYPLYVDPLLATNAVDVDAIDAVDNLGAAVDLDGDRAVVSAPAGADGRVFILERNEGNPNAWGIEQTLVAPVGFDSFGTTLAFDYPYLAVGSPDEDTVHIFEDDGGWSELQVLSGPVAGSGYGAALDLQMPSLVVGAPDDDQGSLYVGSLISGTFLMGPLPVRPTEPEAMGFGASLAIRLPNVLVGAPLTNNDTGAVYVLGSNADLVQTLTGSVFDEEFGGSLAASSARVAVGALKSGRVYLFERQTDATGEFVPSSVPWFTAPPFSTGYGASLDLLNDTLVVGDAGVGDAYAHHYAIETSGWFHVQSTLVSSTNTGAPLAVAVGNRTIAVGAPGAGTKGEAQLMERVGEELVTAATFQATSLQGAVAGRAVAIDGNLAAIGDELATTSFGGQVILYEKATGDWSLQDTLLPQGGVFGATEFGMSVDIEGDLLAIGAPGAEQAQLLRRDATSWTRYIIDNPDPTVENFGEAIAVTGLSLAIGAPQGRGRVHLYSTNTGGAPAFDVTLESGPDGTAAATTVKYGTSVAFDGDLLAIGAPGWDATGGVTDAGMVDLYRVDINGGTESLLRFEGTDPDDRCGFDVDVDDDRLAIGCPNDGAALLPGKAYLYRGDASTWSEEATKEGNLQSNLFGRAVAIDDDRWFVGLRGNSKVQMYQRNTGGEDQWGEELLFDGPNGSNFGTSIDVDGNAIIIGSPKDGVAGSARIFQLDATIPPTLFDDQITVLEDAVDVTLPIVFNDISGTPIPLQAADAVTFNGPDNGNLEVFGELLRFTPDPDYFGTQTFDYTMPGAITTAQVTIEVLPVNDPPIATDDTYDAVEETLLNAASVLANDTDVESPVLTAALVSGPSQSAVFSLQTDGTFTYQAVDDYFGTDSFTYQALDDEGVASGTATVTITVADTPESPVLTDSSWSTPAGTPLLVPAPGLAAPAYAQLPSSTTIFSVADASLLDGTVSVLGNGGFSFVPTTGFTGTTSFQVQADNEGAIGTATVTIDVVTVNRPPEPQPDTYRTDEDQPLEVTMNGVLANDVDPDDDPMVVAFDPASSGTIDFADPGGTFTWTPPADFHGTASLSYTVTDGIELVGPVAIEVTVDPVNDAPFAVDDAYDVEGPGPHDILPGDGVLLNDGDVDGDGLVAALLRAPDDGSVTLDADGGFRFTPRIGAEGTMSFDYLVSDGLATAKATVEIEVTDNPLPLDTAETGGPTPIDTASDCDTLWYADLDGDGFAGDDTEGITACDAPSGFTDQRGDCDDTRADQFPGAPETQGDGIDQDCDGRDADIAPGGACATGGTAPAAWLPLLLLIAGRREVR